MTNEDRVERWTPGPLEARPEDPRDVDGLYMVADLAAPDGVEVCTASYCTKPDAQLYAAAPALYEALDYVMSAHGEQLHDAFDMAQKALSLARGEGRGDV